MNDGRADHPLRDKVLVWFRNSPVLRSLVSNWPVTLVLLAILAFWKPPSLFEMATGTHDPRGATRDMTPVDIVLLPLLPSAEYKKNASHWRIPKAYLNDKQNWEGGTQSVIAIAAALYWDKDDSPPWTIATKGGAGAAAPDDQILIWIFPSIPTPTRKNWEEKRLTLLQPVGDRSDLVEYRYRDGYGRMPDSGERFFSPRLAGTEVIFFDCSAGGHYQLLGCTAQRDLGENMYVHYLFSSNNLNRWAEIDTKVTELLTSLMLSDDHLPSP